MKLNKFLIFFSLILVLSSFSVLSFEIISPINNSNISSSFGVSLNNTNLFNNYNVLFNYSNSYSIPTSTYSVSFSYPYQSGAFTSKTLILNYSINTRVYSFNGYPLYVSSGGTNYNIWLRYVFSDGTYFEQLDGLSWASSSCKTLTFPDLPTANYSASFKNVTNIEISVQRTGGSGSITADIGTCGLGTYLSYNNTYSNVSVNMQSGNWSIGYYNLTVLEFNATTNISNKSIQVYLQNNAILNFTGYFYTIRNLANDETFTYTGGGHLVIPVIKDQFYQFRAERDGYAYYYFNYTPTAYYNTYSIPALNLSNSVFVLCYNESSANRILANSSFTLTNLDSSSIIINSTVNNCAFNYSLLVAGRYELEIDPIGFSARKFQITVSDRSSQVLNAYLLADSLSSAIGMYVRSNLGNVLDGVNVNIYRWVNGSFVSVGNDNTDISGFVQFFLMDAINYRIILSYPLFVTNDFTFTPYLANSPYNFVLAQNISSDFPNVFNNVTFDYSKSNFTLSNSSNYTFYLYTNSVGGALVFSNISCPSFSLQDSNPSGALLSQSVDVSGLSSFNCTFSFRTSLMNSTYSWISFFKVYTPSNSSLIGSLPQISDEVGNRGWMTILAYFIIVFAVIVVARMTSDPRVIGFVILSGIVLFVFVGWIGYLVGGITATIGFFLMFMGGR